MVVCASLCVGAPGVVRGSSRMDASGLNQLCELCGRRLSKVKHHRAHGPGRACHPRCKPTKGAAEGTAAALAPITAAPKQSRKRRAVSDPGQPPPALLARTRLRVRAPRPSPPDRKRLKQEKEAAAMALLEQTHARRVAAMAAASAVTAAAASGSAPHSALNASAVVWE
jgi:hypothetical protein